MRFILLATVVAVLGCKGPAPTAPGAGPGGNGDGSDSGSGDGSDSGSGSAGPTAAAPADAAPAAAPAATDVMLYDRGKFVTVPTATATESDGCLGTPDQLAACKKLKPNTRCELEAPVNAANIRCSGAAMGPGDMPRPGPPVACWCTCSDEYVKAYAAWSKRAQECANVP